MPFIDSSGPPVLPNGHGSAHFSSGHGNSFESSTPVEYILPSDLPIASLEMVDLEGLRAGDLRESKKLFDACLSSGFFYLDLRNVKEGHVAGTIEGMLALDKELYDLDDDEKMAYDIDKLSPLKLNGYKPVGRNVGGIKGKRDGFETYGIPKNGILGLGVEGTFFPRPQIIDQHWKTLQDFTGLMHGAIKAVLQSLSKSLDLPPSEGFESFHRSHVPSPDLIRLLKYHPQPIEERGVPHTPHTDLGSLTILFSRQPGLQILAPGADHWSWVEPLPGHAIVNLGDGMSKLTNGYFHSCLHRVSPLPGRAMQTRYSFAYMLRAEDQTPMTGLKSAMIPKADPREKVVTSGEWIRTKFKAVRLNDGGKVNESVLTGKDEKLPVN